MNLQGKEIKVGLVRLDDGVDAILNLFPGIQLVPPDQLRANDYDVVWLHTSRRIDAGLVHQLVDKLRPYLKQGGGVLLSLCAAPLVAALGYETVRFTIDTKPWHRREDFGWKWDFLSEKGFQAFLEHPIFTGLGSSVMTWASAPGKPYCRAGVEGSPRGDTVAKRKKFIFIETETDEILEYHPGSGRIIVVSSLLFFDDRDNPYLSQLTRLTENILLYLAGQLDGPRHYWPKEFRAGFREELPVGGEVQLFADRYCDIDSPIQLADKAPDQWFDIAGHRAFAVGKYDAGINELWTPPIRILKDVTFTVSSAGESLTPVRQRYTAHPAGLEIVREYEGATVRQTLGCPLDEPGLIVDFAANSRCLLELVIRFKVDFRLMWPYPKFSLGELVYAWDERTGSFTVRTHDNAFAATIGAGRKARGRFDQKREEFEIAVPLASDGTLFVAYGGQLPSVEAQAGYARLMRGAGEECHRAVAYYRALREKKFDVQFPDSELDRAYAWAKVGLDKLYTRTPGVGAGYFAGYGPSRPTEFSDGRPGYAWYFGRDSEWTSFAALGYGDFTAVRDNLSTLLEHQEITGKILHELTTSGVAHFDAADSTPLLVVVLEEYVRRSGDIQFLRAVWSKVCRAMEFMYTTDRDGDGFIENSGVGHGWIEGGELSPYHVSFYLASVWVKALASAAWLAQAVSDDARAAAYASDHARLKRRLNDEFWNPETGFFQFARRVDGSYIPTRTVTPAVAMDFDLIDPDKAARVLRVLAGSEFTADWGVRFISQSDPAFRADGYHQGSVWPLFTGWVARAEYNYHRPVQGFGHLVANLLGYRGWNQGYLEEVLNGEVYQPNGVCSHQGWSEAMAIYPLIDGLFGVTADAIRREIVLAPHLPPHWSRVKVNGIPFGTDGIGMEIAAQPGRMEYRLTTASKGPIAIRLSPGIPGLTGVRCIRLDGHDVNYNVAAHRGDQHVDVAFTLDDEARISIEYEFDLAVVPPEVKLAPGARSCGVRVVDIHRPVSGALDVALEGPQGSDGYIDLIAQRRPKVPGAEVSVVGENRFRIRFRFPRYGGEYTAVMLRCSI